MAPLIITVQLVMIQLYYLLDFKVLPVFTMALTLINMIIFQASRDRTRYHPVFIIVTFFASYLEMQGFLNEYFAALILLWSTDPLIKWIRIGVVQRMYDRNGLRSYIHLYSAQATIFRDIRERFNEFR